MRSSSAARSSRLVVAKPCGGSVAWRSAWAMARASRHLGRHALVHDGERLGHRGVDRLAEQDQPACRRRRQLATRDRQRRHRIGHAHAHFREADLQGHIRHDPPIGAQRQDQAAGNGVAVDRGHQRLRPGVERAEAVVQRIDQPPLAQPVEAGRRLEIEAGGESRAVGSDHRGTDGAIGGQAFEQVGELLQQHRVHGVHGRAGEGDDGDAVLGDGEFQGRHAPTLGEGR